MDHRLFLAWLCKLFTSFTYLLKCHWAYPGMSQRRLSIISMTIHNIPGEIFEQLGFISHPLPLVTNLEQRKSLRMTITEGINWFATNGLKTKIHFCWCHLNGNYVIIEFMNRETWLKKFSRNSSTKAQQTQKIKTKSISKPCIYICWYYFILYVWEGKSCVCFDVKIFFIKLPIPHLLIPNIQSFIPKSWSKPLESSLKI